MRPDIDDVATVQHQDLMAVGQGTEPVRHDQHGPAKRDALDVGIDQRLAFRIERAGGLIQDQDARIMDQRPRDRQTLALAAGQIGRTFLDPGLIAFGQTLDELLGAGQAGGAHRIAQGQAGAAGQDIVLDAAAEQEVFLQHHAEAAPQMRQIDLPQVGAVDLDGAFIFAIDTLQ